MNALAVLLAAGLAAAAPADTFPGRNVTLLGHLDPREDYNDVWGYRAPGGTELAILGCRTGTSFIDATDPSSPREVAFLPGPEGHTRDIKSMGSLVYIVNEDDGAGMQIVSVEDPEHPVLVATYAGAFGTCHNIFIDEPARRLYACYPDTRFRMTVLDLADPLAPVELGHGDLGWVHDVYVRDGIAYTCLLIEGELAVLDASSPDLPRVARWATPLLAPHSVWLNEGGTVCLVTDEIRGGHVEILDVSDPARPRRLSEWTHPDDPGSTVHNVLTRGDLAFFSWYRAGLEILDIADPRFPGRVGWADSSPDSGYAFEGAFGVYPFQPSGTIYVSDTGAGLYLFRFDPDYGSVQGTVRNGGDGSPLAGVRVTASPNGRSVTTGADGEYRLAMPSGETMLSFARFGFATAYYPGVVRRGDSFAVDVPLDPQGAVLTGTVRSRDRLEPVGGVGVSLAGTPLAAVTDAGGGYRFEPVPAGEYELVTEDLGFAPETLEVAVSGARETVRNLALDAAVFADDFEEDRGWTPGLPGDDATAGAWERAEPFPTRVGNRPGAPFEDRTPGAGRICFVTGPTRGEVQDDDVDGGRTTLVSPEIPLDPAQRPRLAYHRWFVFSGIFGGGTSDTFLVDLTADGGASWIRLETLAEERGFWERVEIPLAADLPGPSAVRFRFVVVDGGDESIVEGALDDVQVLVGGGASGRVGTAVPPRVLLPVPNPFREGTSVRFELARAGRTEVAVFDARGRWREGILDAVLAPGPYEVAWTPGPSTAAGVYWIRVAGPGGEGSRKAVFLGR